MSFLQFPVYKCIAISVNFAHFLVCVTEQRYASVFFTRLWSLRTALISDTKNLEISGFQLTDKLFPLQ